MIIRIIDMYIYIIYKNQKIKNKTKKEVSGKSTILDFPEKKFMKKVKNNIMEQSTIVICKTNNKSIMYETWRFDSEDQKWVGYHSIPSWREEDIFLRYLLDDTEELIHHIEEMNQYNIEVLYRGDTIRGNKWRHFEKIRDFDDIPEAYNDERLTAKLIQDICLLLETNEDEFEKRKWYWEVPSDPVAKKIFLERNSFDEDGIDIDFVHIIDSDLKEKSILKRIINAAFKDADLLPRTFLEWSIYNALSVKNREKFPFQLSEIEDETFREEIELKMEEFSDSLKLIVTSLMNFDKKFIEEEYNKSIYIGIYPILDTKDEMGHMTRFERKMMEEVVEIYMDVSIWLDEVTKIMEEYPPLHYDYQMDPSPSIDVSISAIAESKDPEFHRGQSGFGLNNEYPDRILRYRYREEGCDKWIPVD